MNEKQLLINRKFNLNEGRVNWFSALHKLREYPSVQIVDFYDTTSSAGDWGGYIVQKIKKTSYLILFSQENNYPSYGYTIYTDDHISASWNFDATKDDAESILADILAEIYE